MKLKIKKLDFFTYYISEAKVMETILHSTNS